MMKTKILLLVLVLISGCGSQVEKVWPKTPSFIHKSGSVLHADRMESTPFIWTDGRILLMVPARELDKIEIYDGQTLVSAYSSPIGLACAIVVGQRLYVFGATNWTQSGNEIYSIYTEDLITWSAPKVAIPAQPGRTLFNSSVAPMPDGSFVMSYETCETGTVCFNARFATSTDLDTWTEVGTIFHPESYAACPTIRFIDGMYYVFYLGAKDAFITYVSRSSDLINWEDGKTIVISPDESEGTNTSDFDFVEYNGKLEMTYADGDQETYANIRSATYDGTLEQFVKEFF